MSKTTTARGKIFSSWIDFCLAVGRDPSLRDVPDAEDKIAYLLVFGFRYRSQGRGTSKKPVRAGTVEDALLAVGQGITHLVLVYNSKDPVHGSFIEIMRTLRAPLARFVQHTPAVVRG